jgi:hypothetical protein
MGVLGRMNEGDVLKGPGNRSRGTRDGNVRIMLDREPVATDGIVPVPGLLGVIQELQVLVPQRTYEEATTRGSDSRTPRRRARSEQLVRL